MALLGQAPMSHLRLHTAFRPNRRSLATSKVDQIVIQYDYVIISTKFPTQC